MRCGRAATRCWRARAARWRRSVRGVNTIDLAALLGVEPPRGSSSWALGLDARGERLVVRVGAMLHEFDLRDGARQNEYPLLDASRGADRGWSPSPRYTPDGRTLVAAFSPWATVDEEGLGLARVFDTDTGRCAAEITGADQFTTLALDPTGTHVLFTGFAVSQVNRVSDGALLATLAGTGEDGSGEWDPSSGEVLLLRDGAVQTYDPRDGEARRRFEVSDGTAEEFIEGRLFLRAVERLATVTTAERLGQVDLPWGTRLWCDVYDTLLWLSEDGATAFDRSGDVIERLRADAPRETLVRMSPEPDLWKEFAVSHDGAVVAWVEGTHVRWERVGGGR